VVRWRGVNIGIGRSSQEADAFHQIHTKRLKTTERVTAVGFSSAPGDAIVKGIGGEGTIELIKPLHQEEGTITIKDPRLITTYHKDDDSSRIFTLMGLARQQFLFIIVHVMMVYATAHEHWQ
jgi:hypothetical protein